MRKSHFQSIFCTLHNYCLRKHWRYNTSQIHDVTNEYSNIRKYCWECTWMTPKSFRSLLSSAWTAISECTRALPWTLLGMKRKRWIFYQCLFYCCIYIYKMIWSGNLATSGWSQIMALHGTCIIVQFTIQNARCVFVEQWTANHIISRWLLTAILCSVRPRYEKKIGELVSVMKQHNQFKCFITHESWCVSHHQKLDCSFKSLPVEADD